MYVSIYAQKEKYTKPTIGLRLEFFCRWFMTGEVAVFHSLTHHTVCLDHKETKKELL